MKKYLELFKDGFDATIAEKIKPANWPYVGYSPSEGVKFTVVPEPHPDNEIWYTSSDGNVVTPYKTDVFGANIVSNTYEDGKGVITFDDSVTSIGKYAFRRRSRLASITIPNSVTSIGGGAFERCTSLTSITIPNSVTSIGGRAFDGCSSLTSMVIPDGVTSIGQYAFNDCKSLTSIVIPDSVTSIGQYAFNDCLKLASIVVETGNTTYDSRENCNAIIHTATNTLIRGCQNTIIPSSVTSIGSSAFYHCTSLTSVTIPNSVTSIGEAAFSSCSSLTSVTIPNSVTSIGKYAFEGCSSLTKTNYTGDIAGWCNIMFGNNIANPMCYSHNFYINDKEIKDLVIPNSVDSIYDFAFYDCSSLTSIIFEGTIGDWNSITKGSDWNYNVPATYVQCTDGQATL